MVQESREIDLRERMEGQANGGEDNLDPIPQNLKCHTFIDI